MKTRVFRRLLAVSAAGVLASMFVSAPAYAGVMDGNCDSGEVCLYKNANFSSGGLRDTNIDMSNYSGYIFPFHCNLNCGLNDAVSSMKNRTSSQMKFFQNSFGGGAILNLSSGSSQSDLSGVAFPGDLGGGNWNDRISSHCINDASPPSWCG